MHSVGTIEVEVLGVGEPPPRLALYVSCPSDVGRKLLTVGNVVDVTFHARRQSWPKPVVRPPEHLPVRYIKSIAVHAQDQPKTP